MTPEELNASLARRDRPAPKPSREAEMLRTIGSFMQKQIDKAVAPLKEHIQYLEKQLEKIERKKYVGVWSEAGKYYDGQMVTLDGSIFCCLVAETTQRPATGPDWVLCVKRGRDGKDASRQPTQARTYGT
jgi:hypothetical protein